VKEFVKPFMCCGSMAKKDGGAVDTYNSESRSVGIRSSSIEFLRPISLPRRPIA
jgi:hypothetical protein